MASVFKTKFDMLVFAYSSSFARCFRRRCLAHIAQANMFRKIDGWKAMNAKSTIVSACNIQMLVMPNYFEAETRIGCLAQADNLLGGFEDADLRAMSPFFGAILTPLPWPRPLPFQCHARGHTLSIAIGTAIAIPVPWLRRWFLSHGHTYGHSNAMVEAVAMPSPWSSLLAFPLPWPRPLLFHCHGHDHCHWAAMVTAIASALLW